MHAYALWQTRSLDETMRLQLEVQYAARTILTRKEVGYGPLEPQTQ